MSASFHVMPMSRNTGGLVPIAVTLYLSEEIFEDAESAPADYLAERLQYGVAAAIKHYREHPEQAEPIIRP